MSYLASVLLSPSTRQYSIIFLFTYTNQKKLNIQTFYLAETVQELDLNLQSAVEVITNSSFRITGVSSGCALFMRFITFAKLDTIVSIFNYV